MAMPFSNTTSNLGIVQQYERFTGLGLTGVSSVATALDECVAFVNQANREMWVNIFLSYGGWQHDDSGQTDLPSATATLTASQTTYALPTGYGGIRGVSILNTGNTWEELSPITEEQIRESQSPDEFLKTPAVPRFYRLVGDTMYLHPPSNYTQASSLKVSYDRGSVDFADTDTTRNPGFFSEFHDFIPVRAACMWLLAYEATNPKLPRLQQEADKLLNAAKKFYASRFEQLFPPRITVRDPMTDAC